MKVQFNARLFHNIDTAVSAALKNSLSTLHHSEVKLVLYKDPVLIAYGNKLCKHFRNDGDQRDNIAKKLRRVARLLIQVRTYNSKITDIKDMIHPKNYDNIVRATQDITGWNDEEGTISVCPKLAILSQNGQNAQNRRFSAFFRKSAYWISLIFCMNASIGSVKK